MEGTTECPEEGTPQCPGQPLARAVLSNFCIYTSIGVLARLGDRSPIDGNQ